MGGILLYHPEGPLVVAACHGTLITNIIDLICLEGPLVIPSKIYLFVNS